MNGRDCPARGCASSLNRAAPASSSTRTRCSTPIPDETAARTTSAPSPTNSIACRRGCSSFAGNRGWTGLYVNREPVTRLPLELKPGDWWFIQDGDTYAGVRPLEATHLRGPCKTTLEERTRQIVLYQDNYVGDTIDGIADEEWVKARSGFVVEMGDAAEYGSFERFRDIMLKAKVKESADGFIRHIQYQRPGRRLEMKWHCYEEKYLVRRVDGQDQTVCATSSRPSSPLEQPNCACMTRA